LISKSTARLVAAAAMTGAAVLVAPGTAAAAAAPGRAYVVDGVLYFAAGAGVANYPSVGANSGGRVYLLDDRAPVQLDTTRAGGCVQAQSSEVYCSGITRIVAYLGDGDDTFSSYHNMTTVVYGQEGKDTLYGWFGNDELYGGLGDDKLYGLPGHDIMYGEQGKDTIEGDDGADQIVGGAGDDTLRGDAGVDRISGEAGRDMVYGGPDGDILNGGGGAGVGSDSGYVYGEHGDDFLSYDLSSTQYYGGEGVDTIDYSQSRWPMRVSLFDNSYDMTLPEPDDAVPWSHDAHSDIEKLNGTAYNDELTGNRGPNTISGGNGNDKIWGSDGDDVLDADLGANQRIVGGIGIDVCVGAGVTYRESCEE
jgi:Ca2+-binding RTX toxin-like protein